MNKVAIVDTAGRNAGVKLCQPEAGAHLSQLEISAGILPATQTGTLALQTVSMRMNTEPGL